MKHVGVIALLGCGLVLASVPRTAAQPAADVEALKKQVTTLSKAGKIDDAIPIARTILALREQQFGVGHPNTFSSYNRLAGLYEQKRDYKQAEAIFVRALQLAEEGTGSDSATTANAQLDLLAFYLRTRDRAKASALHERALQTVDKAFGPEAIRTASILRELASVYSESANHTQALSLAQRALEISQATSGPEHPDTAHMLMSLGGIFESAEDYNRAEAYCQRALAIREKTFSPEDPAIADSLATLANLYLRMGAYAKAEPLYQRLLEIDERIHGHDHLNSAATLNAFGELYRAWGRYDKAVVLLRRALGVLEKLPDHEDARTATVMMNLGVTYWRQGDYAAAEPVLHRALQILEKDGAQHPTYWKALNNLAMLCDAIGDYARTMELLQRALTLREQAGLEDHSETAVLLSNLSEIHKTLGDYPRAEALIRRALRITEKVLGVQHPQTGRFLINLAALYDDLGDFAQAETLALRALRVVETGLGPKHPTTASVLTKLAGIFQRQGDYTNALARCERALRIRVQALGSNHAHTALSLGQLASLCEKSQDYVKAQRLRQRALEITEKTVGSNHLDLAVRLNDLAVSHHRLDQYERAESLCRRALEIHERMPGRPHRESVVALRTTTFVLFDAGKPADALEMAVKERRVRAGALEGILAFAPEQQRLSFQALFQPFDLLGTFGASSELAAEALQIKGVILDSVLEDRSAARLSANPELNSALDQLSMAKRQMMRLLIEEPSDQSEERRRPRQALKETLSRQIESVEGSLARHVAGLGRARQALSVTPEQVRAALPDGTVLIELLRYKRYVGKVLADSSFGALVLDHSQEPVWVPLGVAPPIERAISQVRRAVATRENDPEMSRLLGHLYRQLWAPIEMALPPGTRTVIFSPDGQLNFVSFATLLAPDGKLLGEKYSIRHVASGRDLLRELPPTTNNLMVVCADPAFSGAIPSEVPGVTNHFLALRAPERRDLATLQLTPLPGTAREARLLEDAAKKVTWHVRSFLGTNATEARLQSVQSPRVLHLATHGFFLNDDEPARGLEGTRGVGGARPLGEDDFLGASSFSATPRVVLKNPMHRSGLALAGAQATLDAWKRGEVPPTENDGIVTADEVGTLKLDGTWLVVLSACDTGTGEARSGEGVLGLRRGFVMAGAQNLLMTLWPVADQETADFMVDFYEAAHKTGNAPKALADVQRDWLVRLRKERGLAEAVRLAGPFIMNSQGAVK